MTARDLFALFLAVAIFPSVHAAERQPNIVLIVNGIPGRDGKPANYENMKPNSIEESGIRGIASRHGYRVQKLELSLFDLSTDPGEKRQRRQETKARRGDRPF